MGNLCGPQGKPPAVKLNTDAPDVSPEEVQQQALEDAFKVYDVNNDKFIQKEELALVLESYHKKKPTQRQLGKILSKVDLNEDGKIDYGEFCKMMNGRSQAKSDIAIAFEKWDKNKDGFISREELKQVLNEVEDTSDEEIEEILTCADIDGDNRINVEEFLKFFM